MKKINKMNVPHDFSKELIDTIKQFGIIVSELDEHGNVINYYNLPQWFKEVNGHISLAELTEKAKHLTTNCQ